MKTIPTSKEFYSDTQKLASEHGIKDLQKEECQQFFLAYLMFQIKASDYYSDKYMSLNVQDDFTCIRYRNGFYFICGLSYSDEEDSELARIKKEDPDYYADLMDEFEEINEMMGYSEEESKVEVKEILAWKQTVKKELRTFCRFQYMKLNSKYECEFFDWVKKSYHGSCKKYCFENEKIKR